MNNETEITIARENQSTSISTIILVYLEYIGRVHRGASTAV